jgi:hypothetical protein
MSWPITKKHEKPALICAKAMQGGHRFTVPTLHECSIVFSYRSILIKEEVPQLTPKKPELEIYSETTRVSMEREIDIGNIVSTLDAFVWDEQIESHIA